MIDQSFQRLKIDPKKKGFEEEMLQVGLDSLKHKSDKKSFYDQGYHKVENH